MKLLKVLENRNYCLKRIAEFSQTFLTKFVNDDFTDLDAFENWRNSAIKTLTLYDNYINSLATTYLQQRENDNFDPSVRNLLEITKNIIYYILTIDMEIIERIEREKGVLLKQLAVTEQNKRTVIKFRSEIPSKSGGQLDDKI